MAYHKNVKLLAVPIFFLIGLWIYGCSTFALKQDDENSKIVIYAAAGLRAPIELLACEYEEQNSKDLEIVYGSSGNLRNQIDSQEKGDVFIPGDPRFLNNLKYKDAYQIAFHFPVLVLNKEYANDIKSVKDLKHSDLKLILVNVESTALGNATEKIIEDMEVSEILEDRLYGRVATANQVPLYLSLGKGGAGICWYSNYLQYEDELALLDLPKRLQKPVPIVGVVLSNSNNSEEAGEFIRFLTKQSSRELFLSFGYGVDD